EAGLDAANFRLVPPRWVSPEPFDTRAEWVGPAPGLPEIPLTVAAAAYSGRPVSFEVLGPWSRPLRMQPPPQTLSQRIAQNTVAALLYLALEPYVRRRMPELLIGWTRLLDGRWRDPRVGRDVLVGALAGSIMALGLHVTNAPPTWIPFPGQTTLSPNDDALYGGRRLVSFLLAMPVNVLLPSMFLFCALVVLRVVLRRPALAVTGLMLLATLLSLGGENVTLETPDA